MELVERIENIKEPYNNAVITIGNFDGVHLGHQALFHEVIEKADAISGTSIAMTFEPHPLQVLKKEGHPPRITMYEQKIELIKRSGLDVLICAPFTKDFANITAMEFLEDLLVKRLGVKVFVAGGDYSFGRDREGNLDFIRTHGQRLGVELIVADWIQFPKNDPARISSTRIREYVSDGRVAEAQRFLGRHYQIRGVVETGRNRGGRLLGFPTANIKLHDELAPKSGVYAVTVECSGGQYKGVANIGFSPTFDDHIFTVEVHILDFNENIYGEKIRVNFIQRIRDEKKFSGIDELSQQITRDIETARGILSL